MIAPASNRPGRELDGHPRLHEPAERALIARGALERVRGERASVVSKAQAIRPADGGLDPAWWNLLLSATSERRCVPIVGPGVSADILPLGAEMAQSLAYRYNLPLKDAHDLARVTEAAETKVSRLIVREELAEVIRSSGPPDFSAAGQPHAVLARLPFDLYITASFDNILETALQQGGRLPRVEIVISQEDGDKRPHADFTPESPLVLHFYGHASQPASCPFTDGLLCVLSLLVSRERSSLTWVAVLEQFAHTTNRVVVEIV